MVPATLCFLPTLPTLVSSKCFVDELVEVSYLLAFIQAIYAMISPDIKPNPNEPGAYGISCRLISSLSAQIDITFTSQQGHLFNLTIPKSELSVGPFANDSSTCQTFINAFDGFPAPMGIMGGSLFKHYYSIWDVGGQRIGFAPVMSAPKQAQPSQPHIRC